MADSTGQNWPIDLDFNKSWLTAADISTLDPSTAFFMKVKTRLHGIKEHYKKNYTPQDTEATEKYNNITNELTHILDNCVRNNVIVSKTDIDKFNSMPKTLEEHLLQLFGGMGMLEEPKVRNDNFMSYYYEKLKERTYEGRKTEIVNRIKIAAEDLCENKLWFCVFNTLTVAPYHYEKVFKKGSKCWRNYIENIDNYFGVASFKSVREAKRQRKLGNEYHLYVAVTERGTIGGHLHIHVLHFFKDMPTMCSDPNRGAIQPINKEIDDLKTKFWPWGTSHPEMVRFGQSDAYGQRLNWIMRKEQIKTKQGFIYKPIECKPSSSVCNYIAKYVNKSYNTDINKENTEWRTKISRNLGKKQTLQIVQQIPLPKMIIILKEQKTIRYGIQRLPRILTRRLMLKFLWKKLSNYGQQMFLADLMTWSPLPNIAKQIVDLYQKLWNHSQLNFGRLQIKAMYVMEGFKETIPTMPIMGGVCETVS